MPSTQNDDFDPDECLVEFDLEELNPSPLPLSPIQALVQSVAASIPPITAAAPSRAVQWKEMTSAQARAQKRLNELVKNDPELSRISNEYYGMRFEAAPFMKAKEGTSKVFPGHHRPYTDAIRGREVANGNSELCSRKIPFLLCTEGLD